MKKYLMNKNVEHDGKFYAKGVEISEGDKGYKELIEMGHADEFLFKDEAPADADDKSEKAGKSKK